MQKRNAKDNDNEVFFDKAFKEEIIKDFKIILKKHQDSYKENTDKFLANILEEIKKKPPATNS